MAVNTYEFQAEMRDKAGKGVARALRRENRVPAVIYGDNKEPVLIHLSARDVGVQYNKGQMFTNVCDMKIGNDRHRLLARDIQLHPVTDTVEHIDFLRVTSKTKITVDVPVNFIDEDKSEGMKEGAILNIVRYAADLLCSATAIPESINVSLEGKAIGDSVKLSEAQLPDGATSAITDRDVTLATLVAPKVVSDEPEAVEGEEGADGEEGSSEGGDTEEKADA